MAIKAADVSKLRKMTGAGMMDCKNALTECDGDFDAAVDAIRKKGQLVASKRADREATEGCVLAGSKDGVGVVVALRCETDFVAKNDSFVAFAQSILDVVLASDASSIEEANALALEGSTVAEQIVDQTGVIGEKIELAFCEKVEDAAVVSYIHPGNGLAVVVALNKALADDQTGKDVAMQVAAMNPISVSKDDVPADVVAHELEIGKEKAREEGKPEAMLDKIAQGRLGKFFKESTLLEQAFIKENKQSVQQYLTSVEKDLTVSAFKRYALAE